MTPFLKQIAKLFYGKYGADMRRLAFVFPNKRAGMFFRNYLSETVNHAVISPAILTINELFFHLNPKIPADRIKLLFMLYDVYIRQSGSDETFDDFVYWGEMLLNDFDDIDKNLIDARQLFTNVIDLNTIERDLSFLQPSQIQAIRSFWSSFQPVSADENKRFFLRIWQLLYPIYTDLRRRLVAEGQAYEGMVYREVIEEMTGFETLSFEKIVFVGLNALTKAEKELFKNLKKQHLADFYWDYGSEMLQDEDNRASFFMKENISLFPSEWELPTEEPVQTQFELIGIPSRIGQAKQLYPLLERLYGTEAVSAEEAMKTAIVLPDEQLLMPVLSSIPENIVHINVTLGYSLAGTAVASLIDYLHALQKNYRKNGRETLFYHRDVVAILKHQYISSACGSEAEELIKDITERNQVYISEMALGGAPLLKLIFMTPTMAKEVSDYLMAVLGMLDGGGHGLQIRANEEVGTHGLQIRANDQAEAIVETMALEREYIGQFYKMVERMGALITEAGMEMTSDTYFRLLKQMTGILKIPFSGEPLSGLQVMGVLETRALDFENLIILSMNEGVFPSQSANHSFIPYHLRLGFGLPAREHQESIPAYHFYRMIQRAKRVAMLYDTRTDGLQSGEVSRYVHQLKSHYKTPIRQKLSVYNIASSRVNPFCYEKDEAIMQALAAFETEKSLSASAINMYLDCPLKFYFTVIKGIEEEETVSETLEHDTFGTLLHRVMELIYKPLCGKLITADLLKSAAQEKNMTEKIQEAFALDYFHSKEIRPLTGQAFLYGETIRKYADKVLAYDRSVPPFTYVGSEKLIHSMLKTTSGRQIRIKGFIDRLDRRDDTVRIVDYKSGRSLALTFDTIESLFDKTAKERKKAIMQVFLYAWLYASETGERKIQPAVYYTRDLFKGSFDPTIRRTIEKETTVVDDFDTYREAFEDHLRTCIDEMFDAGKPFIQTSNIKSCEYCPFTGVCGR